jgi:hypothetical protein
MFLAAYFFLSLAVRVPRLAAMAAALAMPGPSGPVVVRIDDRNASVRASAGTDGFQADVGNSTGVAKAVDSTDSND